MSLPAAVEHSAAPAAVGVALARLTEAHPGLADRLEEDTGLRGALIAVAGASRSLTELCLSDPTAVDILADLDRRPQLGDDLRRWKRLELLRIAARDLLGIDDLPVVGAALARLAAEVLQAACARAGPPGQVLAVIGMGKLGGAELNYSSDIDIMFVGEGDPDADFRAARAVLDVARTCFRVDVDLRPEGRDGPLVRSLESYEAYWDRWAHTWEFQALLKARSVAGDQQLGGRFYDAAQARLWQRPFTADDLRYVRTMKARAEAELARKGLTDREVKRGRGGIRDIEFSVQLLQLVHGAQDPALRSPTTLDALAELGAGGYVDASDARALDFAYRLLRAVEHRLQLVAEQQVHTLPADPAALDRLARVMGYRDTPEAPAGQLLAGYLRRQRATVRTIHEHLFFRPLLDQLTQAGAGDGASAAPLPEAVPILPEAVVATRLSAFGFADAQRTRQALQELTRGLTRSSRLMKQMLPLLLGWLSESPDPDLGLLGLRVLTAGDQQATELAVAFRESPEVARRLCLLLGTGRVFAQTLEHQPDLIPALGQPDGLAPRSPDGLRAGAVNAVAWREHVPDRQAALLRYKRREELRVAAADVLDLAAATGDDQVVVTAGQLTALAEACVDAALASIEPPLPFAVLAMGRFGGAELSYASDLDLLFVYDGASAEDFSAAERVAESLVRFLAGASPPSRVYPVDLDLRPEGKDGPLARSLEGYRAYYERWARTWERQALVRARPVAGDPDLARRLMEVVEPHVWGAPLTDEEVREIRRMKARIERERLPAGDDPQFHLKLGRGSLSDVEFCAQLLQLRTGVRSPGTMAALAALESAGALSSDDHAVLAEAYRFCERARNRLFLVRGTPGDALPARSEQLTRLARSLGTSPQELREQYRRTTRRSRAVVERLFYGKT
ncbi:MAG TPA: bifunctional [glutamine synthetase] adenylyltransferase/[glutamine synthetase]-adenylyl-L-tyrosine phosphorylase [Acidimicrobiales bacterium]|nr:bifunctional [glutamine synthetase] adenylyltransferase/[glutamine synthetase]-adenylyl-L-tyrosine phosphorylase [Acidimicrobiales bacterium]